MKHAIKGFVTYDHAYAEGRNDQAEDQPIPDAALKLLDVGYIWKPSKSST